MKTKRIIIVSAWVALVGITANSQTPGGADQTPTPPASTGGTAQNQTAPGSSQTPGPARNQNTSVNQTNLPPGLQNREQLQLPPGLQNREQLPPGLAQRTNNAAATAAEFGSTNQFGATNNRFSSSNQFGAS